MVYTATGENPIRETKESASTSSGANRTIRNAGTTIFNVWTIDNAGNKSANAKTITVIIDKTVPNAPTVTVNNTSIFENGWYKDSTVTATITAGSDKSTNTSGIYGTSYTITTGKGNSATTSSETKNEGPSRESISGQNYHTLNAYTVDNAGNKTIKTTTVNIDTTAPALTSLTCTPYDTTHITMQASGGSDSFSGIKGYAFWTGESSTNLGAATRVETTSSSGSTTYNVGSMRKISSKCSCI